MKILEFFQTKKLISPQLIKDKTDYEINQIISKRRKNLINGSGIKTDLESIMRFSSVCKRFNDIIRTSDTGKLLLTICINSESLEIADKLEHISYCHEERCNNVCHYVNKDVKYSNPIKKIALAKFMSHRTESYHRPELLGYLPFLTDKQIQKYFGHGNRAIKNSKLNEKIQNESSEFDKSTELDSI